VVSLSPDRAEHAPGSRLDGGELERPTYVERLAFGWLSALGAAEAAILGNGSRLSSSETRAHLQRLRVEHEQVAGLLEELAHRERGAALLVDCLHQPTVDIRLLRLPTGVRACIFDLEGALTTSAALHCDAWRLTLDPFLLAYSDRLHRAFIPFDPHRDYPDFLAGRARLAGLRAFLTSRAIGLREGEPADRAGTESVHGLANRKHEGLHHLIEQKGVEAFAGSRAYLEVASVVGARRGVVSASANTALVLQRAGIADLIEAQIDGDTVERESLRPKPAPDMLLAACARLGVEPAQAAAFETTPAGIAAARAAGIRLAVAVARDGHTGAFAGSDADLIVTDLGEVLERSGG
jgi:beta-phosphoglucomutase-like phosphatase (HAD superfamily)